MWPACVWFRGAGASQSILEMTQKDFTDMLNSMGDAAPKAVGLSNDVGSPACFSMAGLKSVFNQALSAIKSAPKNMNSAAS